MTNLSGNLTTYLVEYAGKRNMPASFAQLFKKYRLKAEFSSLSQFGTALADKGFIYEDSIFSHWQKGNRIPNNREILLSLIAIFAERGALNSLDEANELLSTVHQGYLTNQEVKKISLGKSHTAPFQVPREIAYFTGRDDIIDTITHQVSQNNVFLIHGPSGVGKTALAIALGHRLKKKFPDGVLWYKVDSSNPMDILLSIAYTFRENISAIQNLETRASVVRSILANKKILVIFDNVEQDTNIRVLLPNSSSTVILTSKYEHIPIDSSYKNISLTSFTNQETSLLFTKILSREYVKNHTRDLEQLAEKVDNLPLPVHMYAKQLAITKQSPKSLLHKIETANISLQALAYEDKNLYASIDISFRSLDEKIKKIFLSLGIFAGKDFSLEAIAAIHTISKSKALEILHNLINASLLEESAHQRYRLHPLIKLYIFDTAKSDLQFYIKPAANYYATFLEKNKRKNTKFYNAKTIYSEKENILFILEQCEKQKLVQEIIHIWENLGMFFTQTGEWEKVIHYGEKIYHATKMKKTYWNYTHIKYTMDILVRIYYFQGDIPKAQEIITEGSQIAHYLQDEYLIQFCNQRLGKMYQCVFKLDQALDLLVKSLVSIKKYDDVEELAYTYKFIGEVYIFKKDYGKAMDNFQKSFQILKKTKDIILLAIIHVSIGSIYYLENQYEQAENSIMKAINLEKKYDIKMGVRVFGNLILALISKEQKESEKAEKYFFLAKQENQYLNIKNNAYKMFAIVFSLKEKLKQAGYYIFE